MLKKVRNTVKYVHEAHTHTHTHTYIYIYIYRVCAGNTFLNYIEIHEFLASVK